MTLCKEHGKLEQRVTHLEKTVDEIRIDNKATRATVQRGVGAVVAILSLVTIGGFVLKLLSL